MSRFIFWMLLSVAVAALPANGDSDHSHEKATAKKCADGSTSASCTPSATATETHADEKHDHDEHEDDEHKKGDEHAGDENHAKHDEEGGHAHEDAHDDHGSGDFGKGKAIEAVRDEGKAFRLSSTAESRLSIQYGAPTSLGSGAHAVPLASVVEYRDQIGVFVRRDGWFTLLPARLLRREKERVVLQGVSFLANEQIVTSGTPLLRIAHLQASGEGGQGHAH